MTLRTLTIAVVALLLSLSLSRQSQSEGLRVVRNGGGGVHRRFRQALRRPVTYPVRILAHAQLETPITSNVYSCDDNTVVRATSDPSATSTTTTPVTTTQSSFLTAQPSSKMLSIWSLLNQLWPNGKDALKLRLYLILSLGFMVLGKWFALRVPFILQRAVDKLSTELTTSLPLSSSTATVATATATAATAALTSQPFWRAIALSLLYYGLAKAFAVLCAELKTCLFVNVSQRVLKDFSLSIFSHLQTLDSAFFLTKPAGVISVAYVRAIRGLQQFLFQLVFSVAPILLELGMVAYILFTRFGGLFAVITVGTFALYLSYTIWITQLRTRLREKLISVDNDRNAFFLDALGNHEVVQLFTNEQQAVRKYDRYLQGSTMFCVD
jgi:hypothetical protein